MVRREGCRPALQHPASFEDLLQGRVLIELGEDAQRFEQQCRDIAVPTSASRITTVTFRRDAACDTILSAMPSRPASIRIANDGS